MRDGFGGAFMIKILLVFLAVYIIFIAVAFNYARAFRVKNKLIDIIEQNEGIRNFQDKSREIGEIESYLNSVSYRVDLTEKMKKNRGECDDQRGYCIQEIRNASSQYDDETIYETYYKVTTFVVIELPFFKDFKYPVAITGETRKIERVS